MNLIKNLVLLPMLYIRDSFSNTILAFPIIYRVSQEYKFYEQEDYIMPDLDSQIFKNVNFFQSIQGISCLQLNK